MKLIYFYYFLINDRQILNFNFEAYHCVSLPHFVINLLKIQLQEHEYNCDKYTRPI